MAAGNDHAPGIKNAIGGDPIALGSFERLTAQWLQPQLPPSSSEAA